MRNFVQSFFGYQILTEGKRIPVIDNHYKTIDKQESPSA